MLRRSVMILVLLLGVCSHRLVIGGLVSFDSENALFVVNLEE